MRLAICSCLSKAIKPLEGQLDVAWVSAVGGVTQRAWVGRISEKHARLRANSQNVRF